MEAVWTHTENEIYYNIYILKDQYRETPNNLLFTKHLKC